MKDTMIGVDLAKRVFQVLPGARRLDARRCEVSPEADARAVTDMRRGMNTLALQVQEGSGVIRMPGRYFASEGARATWSRSCGMMGQATSLYLKRLEAGKFIWPVSRSGDAVQISAAQLGYLLEGIDWRNPRWTQRPAKVG